VTYFHLHLQLRFRNDDDDVYGDGDDDGAIDGSEMRDDHERLFHSIRAITQKRRKKNRKVTL
jgi:hypothetical protein